MRRRRSGEDDRGVGGRGVRDDMLGRYGISNFFRIPFRGDIASMGDGGVPFVEREGGEVVKGVYEEVAECVVRECSKVNYGREGRGLKMEFWSERREVEIKGGGGEVVGFIGGKVG